MNLMYPRAPSKYVFQKVQKYNFVSYSYRLTNCIHCSIKIIILHLVFVQKKFLKTCKKKKSFMIHIMMLGAKDAIRKAESNLFRSLIIAS